MEQQEEKKRKVYTRRRRTQSKSTSASPLDLTSEILLRPPAKSVVRFRCVSKFWSSITNDPYFTNKFKTRSSTRPSLLLSFQEGDKLFVFSIPQHHHQNSSKSYTSPKPIHRYHLKLHECSYFSPTESVHGLICFQESRIPVVCNPSTGQCITLSKPEKNWKGIIVFLGYDPIVGKHKVVCMPRDDICDECRVFTLGSTQESWRTVKTNHQHDSFYGYGRCINGLIYYQANIINQPVIMSFDVRFEKFGMIELPSDVYKDGLMTYEGKLACVKTNTMKDDGITLLILEDAEKHKWLSKDFVAPFFHYDPSSGTKAQLKGMTPAGEFVYVPNGFYKSFYVIFYDLEKNSFRKVEFEGIVDDEFRLNNGVVNGRVYVLHTFPNHIESLMSL